eukprot:gene13368-biopygen2685
MGTEWNLGMGNAKSGLESERSARDKGSAKRNTSGTSQAAWIYLITSPLRCDSSAMQFVRCIKPGQCPALLTTTLHPAAGPPGQRWRLKTSKGNAAAAEGAGNFPQDIRPEKISDPVPQGRFAMQKRPNGEDPRNSQGIF